MCFLLRHPEEFAMTEEKAPAEIFVTPLNKKLYEILLKRMKESECFSISLLADELSPDEMGRISGIEAKYRELTINSDVLSDCANVLRNCKKNNNDDLSDDDLRSIFKSKTGSKV